MSSDKAQETMQNPIKEAIANSLSHVVHNFFNYATGAVVGVVGTLVVTSVVFFWRFDPTVEALSLKAQATSNLVEVQQEQIDLNQQSISIINAKLDLMLEYFDVPNPYLP